MTAFLFLTTYLAILVFLIACVIRGLQYARTPQHLRWELYPAPHNFSCEVKLMFYEILFLKSLWEFNRKLWFRSFPFHFGLYFLIATLALLALNASTGIGFQRLYTITGVLGLGLGIIGALGLLALRITDSSLKNYSTRGDIFNLILFIVTFAFLSTGYILRPVSAPDMLELSRALLAFDSGIEIHGLLAVGLFLSAILTAYIPMTHMSHFIAKYFTYHSVRWDDKPNRRGGKIEKRLAECLSYRPIWSAAHVKADGKKTWAEISASNPAQEIENER
jgi:nitrate reductase gamma subunit